jgi:hypothetical protein
MKNNLTDLEIQELIVNHKDLERKILTYKNLVKELEKENKTIMKTIHDNCKHNWVKDPNYYTYDERPNRCTKCNLVN